MQFMPIPQALSDNWASDNELRSSELLPEQLAISDGACAMHTPGRVGRDVMLWTDRVRPAVIMLSIGTDRSEPTVHTQRAHDVKMTFNVDTT